LKKIDRWIEEELMSKYTIDVYLNSGSRGACRACAYALTGSLNSPFFACDEAYKKGLFLESRIIH
jgi:hypothetical protein